MIINLLESKLATVNYDTFNEVYIVIEADGTSSCSSAEVLLQQYKPNVDESNFAQKITQDDVMRAEVTHAISVRQRAVEICKKYPIIPC